MPATSAARAAAATQNGSAADIRPIEQRAASVAATAVHAAPGAMKRFERMLSATLACSWMPGIEPRAERRLEHVDEARERDADEDDLVLEDVGRDVRLLAVCDLALRLAAASDASYDGYGRLPLTSAGAR